MPCFGFYTEHESRGALHWTGSQLNSLAPGRSGCDSKNKSFNLVFLIDIFKSSHDNALWWMPWDLTDDKSTLVQVMAWCRQASSHYLSLYWLSFLSPYGVARPQWLNWSVEYTDQYKWYLGRGWRLYWDNTNPSFSAYAIHNNTLLSFVGEHRVIHETPCVMNSSDEQSSRKMGSVYKAYSIPWLLMTLLSMGDNGTYPQPWHWSGALNRMAWQWAETLVEIRGILADIRRTTK